MRPSQWPSSSGPGSHFQLHLKFSHDQVWLACLHRHFYKKHWKALISAKKNNCIISDKIQHWLISMRPPFLEALLRSSSSVVPQPNSISEPNGSVPTRRKYSRRIASSQTYENSTLMMFSSGYRRHGQKQLINSYIVANMWNYRRKDKAEWRWDKNLHKGKPEVSTTPSKSW